ncbi:MAG: SusE domain-containing protein [Bacteroidota bacterium]
MKKIISIITVFVGIILVITSCEDERENPVLDISQIQAPVILDPTGGDYVLLQENAENQLFTIEWEEADYVMDSIVKPSYAVEIDLAGNDFQSPATLSTTTETSVDVTVNRMNDISGVLGLPVEVSADLELRVRSFYSDASEMLTVTSDPVSISVTPFEFKAPPIYILGNGTEAGWDNTLALEMENVEDATYAIVTTLGESGDLMKFISVLGQWAPQWGTDDDQTQTVEDGVVSGELVYRQTEDDPDPQAILTPETPGEYRVVADTTGLTYSAEPVTSALSVIGDVVSAGWNPSEAVEMEKVDEGEFKLVVNLDGSQNSAIQFVDDQNNTWGSSYPFVTASKTLVKTFAGKQSQKVVKLPEKQGTYVIEVNLATNRFLIREQK